MMNVSLVFLISASIVACLVVSQADAAGERSVRGLHQQQQPQQPIKFRFSFDSARERAAAAHDARTRSMSKKGDGKQRGLFGQGSAAVGGIGFGLQMLGENSWFYRTAGKFFQGFGYTLGTFDMLFEYIPLIGVALG